MNTSKVAKTPKNKTPNSAKKKKGSAVKALVDTPRPILSAKKLNGLKTPVTPKNVAQKTPKSNAKKSVVKKVEEEEEDDDDDEDEEMDVDHLKELVMASDDEEDDDEEDDDDDDGDDDDDDDDDDDEEDDEDDDEEIDEKDLEKMLKAIRGKDTKKVATPAKPAKKTEAATPAKTPKAAKAKNTEAATPANTPKNVKKTEAATPAKTPKAGKAKKTEAVTPAKTPKDNKAKKTEAATPAKTPKGDTAKKTEAEEEGKAVVVLDDIQGKYQEQLKYFNERNKRTLFIKRLPSKITHEEISKLSSDILVVRLRKSRDSAAYAFVEFKDEEAANKNIKVLSECSFEGNKIFVDYATTKSSPDAQQKKIGKLDPKKLYITGFPQKSTLEDLQQLVPKAKVTLPTKTTTNLPLGFAFAKFESSELCDEALKHIQGTLLHGIPLIVLYAKLVPLSKEIKRKLDTPKGNPAPKKIKLDKKKKQEEEDEEEEEEDDDDDDDDDEDDDDEDIE